MAERSAPEVVYPFDRTLQFVHRLLRQELNDVEGAVVYASGHSRAVWGTIRSGERSVEVVVEGERWWEPVTRPRGVALGTAVAGRLRAMWLGGGRGREVIELSPVDSQAKA